MKCRNPECGSEVKEDALFCGKCGATVPSVCPVKNCGVDLPVFCKFCSKCGTMVTDFPLYKNQHLSVSSHRAEKTSKEPEIPKRTATKPSTINKPILGDDDEPHTKTTKEPRGSISSTLNIKSEPEFIDDKHTKRADPPADKIKTDRSLGMFIILSIVTFGIYPIVFYTKVSNDLNRIASRYDGKKTMHYCLLFFLVGPITFEIGTLVWFHRLSERVGMELQRRGYEKTISSDTYWLWGILGVFIIIGPFIYLYKLIGAMNQLAKDYNVYG